MHGAKRIAMSIVALVAFSAAGLVVQQHAQAATLTFSVNDCATLISPSHGSGCGPQLHLDIETLQGGQTLRISPGTYDVGSLTMLETKGTSSQPVTVTAANTAQRPLLRGYVLGARVQYLTVSYIDFESAVSKLPALEFLCGVGWRVDHSHIFGAAQTQAFSNMQVSGRQVGPPNPDTGGECTSGPSGFVISNDYFTNPYTSTALTGVPATEYHDLYLGFEGNNATNGSVLHDVFIGNLNGAGIKLQDGKYQTLGPWHVKIAYNTFYAGQRAIFLLDDVRYNTMLGNLIVNMNGGGGAEGPSVGVVTDDVTTNTNTLSHTFLYGVAHVAGDVRLLTPTVQLLTDNRLGPDPAFVSYALQPGNADAARYGAFAADTFG